MQRRHAHWLLLGVVGVGLGPAPAQGSQDGISPPPPVGDCPDCIGDVNGTLNACQLSSSSCVSIQVAPRVCCLQSWDLAPTSLSSVSSLVLWNIFQGPPCLADSMRGWLSVSHNKPQDVFVVLYVLPPYFWTMAGPVCLGTRKVQRGIPEGSSCTGVLRSCKSTGVVKNATVLE